MIIAARATNTRGHTPPADAALTPGDTDVPAPATAD